MDDGEKLAELVGRLGCPAAVCPNRAVQSAELRQRHEFVNEPGWWDGHAQTGPVPSVPMLTFRYAEGLVATFNERPGRTPNVWLRFAMAFYPLGACGRTLDLREDLEVVIAEKSYRASLALADVTDCAGLLVDRRRVEQVAGLTAHISELHRTVAVIGLPDQLDGIHLEWL